MSVFFNRAVGVFQTCCCTLSCGTVLEAGRRSTRIVHSTRPQELQAYCKGCFKTPAFHCIDASPYGVSGRCTVHIVDQHNRCRPYSRFIRDLPVTATCRTLVPVSFSPLSSTLGMLLCRSKLGLDDVTFLAQPHAGYHGRTTYSLNGQPGQCSYMHSY